MFKKVSIIKKVVAIMVAGMMVTSCIPVQAFSIKDSLDKAKIDIQCYWRENKKFRRIVCGGTRYDIGQPAGWLQANMSFAAKDPQYANAIKQWCEIK